jgi:ParB family transcriptional regulator, chromosome partitioning protein
MEKRPALGKGLSALIPDAPEPRSGPIEVDIDLLSPNRLQPRRTMDEPRLAALSASIKENGVIQPIVVRKVDRGYQIIAGERRWRAAQLAGISRVPVVIRDVDPGDDRQLLEVALIENIQRENLNPIEEAEAYRRLSEDFHLSQEHIASAVGKDRASVANYLRLLKLPDEVRAEVAGGRLSMGHARALLGLAEEAAQRRAARQVIAQSLSVRETESLVKKLATPGESSPRAPERVDVHTRAAEDQLKLALGTRVRIVRRAVGGTIEINFNSEDELQRLYEQLTTRLRIR